MSGNTLSGVGYAAPQYQLGLGSSEGVAVPADIYVSPATGSTLTTQTGQVVVNAAATIAALTIQFPSNNVEGARVSFFSDQTTTALTLTAGTNSAGATDTIADAVTAGVAKTKYEYVYHVATSTWYRAQ